MELAIEEDYTARQSQAYSSLNRLFSADVDPKFIYETIEMTRNSAGDAKASIWERLSYLANIAIQRFHVVPGNPSSFADICTAGQLALSLFGLTLGTKSGSEDITLQQRHGVLFLLYTAFTLESFVDFPCGHFALKYEYYRQLQGQLGANTASCGEIAAMKLGCWCCNCDVSEAISRSCAGYEPLPMVPPINPVAKCRLCQRDYEKKLPGLCPEHDICPMCAIKTYLTTHYGCNPCCKTQRSDSDLLVFRKAVEERFVVFISLFELVKHDKRVKNLELFGVKCEICNEHYIFDKSRKTCGNCKVGKPARVKPNPAVPSKASSALLCPNCRQNYRAHVADPKCDICQTQAEMEKMQSSKSVDRTASSSYFAPAQVQRTVEDRCKQLAHPGASKQSTHTNAGQQPSLSRANSAQEQRVDSRSRTAGKREEVEINAVSGKRHEEEIKGNTVNGRTKAQQVNLLDDTESEQRTRSGGTHLKRNKCTICQATYSREDEAYFCPGACCCRRCVIEALVDVNLANVCEFCKGQFDPTVLAIAAMEKKRCHVCGIVVDKGEMDPSAKCPICIKCVLLSSEREFWVIPTIKGRCRIHEKTLFSIDNAYYNTVRGRDPHSACCSFETTKGEVLVCGHSVCATHQEHLRFCRGCRNPIEPVHPTRPR